MSKAKFGQTLQPSRSKLDNLLTVSSNNLPSRSPSPRRSTTYIVKEKADQLRRGGRRKHTKESITNVVDTPRMAVQSVPEVSPFNTPRAAESSQNTELPHIDNKQTHKMLDLKIKQNASRMSLMSEDAVRIYPPSTSPVSSATTPAVLSPWDSIYCRRSSYGSDLGSLNNSGRFDIATPWSDRDIISPTMGITIAISTNAINEVRSSNDPPRLELPDEFDDPPRLELPDQSDDVTLSKTKRRKSKSERSKRQTVTDEYLSYLDHRSPRPKSMALWKNPRIIKLKKFKADPREDGLLPSVNSGRYMAEDSSPSSSQSTSRSDNSSTRSSRSKAKHYRKSRGVVTRLLFSHFHYSF